MNAEFYAATCPICQHKATHVKWLYHMHQIYECPKCATQFVHPVQAAPVEYYQQQYAEILRTTLAGDIHPGFKYTIRQIMAVKEHHLNAKQRTVIDIGCGPGYILSEIERLGFIGRGIDFNPETVRVATEHFHVKADVCRVEDLIALRESFDVALLIHVLEHVDHPMELLKNIWQILNPNGVLLIEVPNRNRFSMNRSLQKGNLHWGEYPPHHLTFWSAKSLSGALALAGYDVLECHARPFAEERQIALFLAFRFKSNRKQINSALNTLLRLVGRLLRLQGESLHIIARRRG